MDFIRKLFFGDSAAKIKSAKYVRGMKLDGSLKQLPPPDVLHHKLTKPLLKENIIIVGDIHGCLDELKLLLKKCSYNVETHSVVLVGDLVNKGPASKQVVQYCRKNGFHSVRGNHDEAVLESLYNLNHWKCGDYVDSLEEYVISVTLYYITQLCKFFSLSIL